MTARSVALPWALPSAFLSQVLHRVAVCSLRDFSHAKQVCRGWRDAGGGEAFETELAKARIDTTQLDKSGTFFDEYIDDWYCYWDGSFDVPHDQEKDYAFRPPLVGTAAGFVTVPGAQLLEGNVPLQTLGVVAQLLHLGKKLADAGASVPSESDSELFPIILPWEPEKPLTPSNVLKLLGAHPQLLDEDCIYHRKEFVDGIIEDIGLVFNTGNTVTIVDSDDSPRIPLNPVSDEFEKFLMGAGFPCVFYTGSEKMNPVPEFYLRRLSDSLIGGFCASLIHT